MRQPSPALAHRYALWGVALLSAMRAAAAGSIKASYQPDMWMPDSTDFDTGGIVQHLSAKTGYGVKAPAVILFHRGAMGYSPNTQPVFAEAARMLAQGEGGKVHIGDINCLAGGGDTAPEPCGVRAMVPPNPEIRLMLRQGWRTHLDGLLFEPGGEAGYCDFAKCNFTAAALSVWVLGHLQPADGLGELEGSRDAFAGAYSLPIRAPPQCTVQIADG